MDAFHTLAADRLIHSVADNQNLIPFTWAICRVFNSLIMIIGVVLVMSRKSVKNELGAGFIISIGIIFGLIAYWIIRYCATTAVLPQTMFPQSVMYSINILGSQPSFSYNETGK